MRRALQFALSFFAAALLARAGIANYSDHGKIDFDTAMQLLNPYGTWTQIGNRWAYTPLDHAAPYTHGRWLYTEYGWYWQGIGPTSWLTEHYGFWKRGADKIWRWYPGPYWLPQIVEIRTTTDGYIGWRCGEVDADGNFVEDSADRYAKVDEWSFVTNRQFTQPITPSVLATPAVVSRLLDESNDSLHSYLTYRAIERPGPHPADFVALAGPSGGMFSPEFQGEEPLVPHPLIPITPHKPELPAPAKPKPAPKTLAAPSGAASDRGATTNAAPNQPESANDENYASTDTRQVRFWNTMSLPTVWTPSPASARPNETYLYRPDFYQDQDGIERRIRLWLHPSDRSLQKEQLNKVLGSPSSNAAPSAPSANPFRSPFGDSFHGDSSKRTAPPPPTNAPGGQQP